MSNPNPPQDEHAVVIGASMAGLLAARVLTDHFERVTLIERDQLPNAPVARKGVPQARHAHILLVRGRRSLDQLFPGLIDAIVADGGVLFDATYDLFQYFMTGQAPRVHSDLMTTSASRDLIEWHVRRRLLALPRVTAIQETDAVGLLAEGGSVRGVKLRHRDAAHTDQELPATIVVDASGRSSRAPEWLTALGYPAPPITTINAFLGYASRIYAVPPSYQSEWKAMLIGPRAPDVPRAGALLPLEGNRWIVTLAGYGRDYPSTEDAGYLEFAKSLIHPAIYDAIRDAKPLTPISGYQRTENQMRHYEQLDRTPDNFFLLGDSVSAFNPVYGQGMTNAAMSAELLDTELRAGLPGAARRFQKALAKQNETPWLLATTEDYRYPTTEGAKPGLSTRFSQWYVKRVTETLSAEPQVFVTFCEVLHLVKPPSALSRPDVLLPVMRHAIFRN